MRNNKSILLSCPKCRANMISILFKKMEKEFTCNTCKAKLQLVGYWWFIILPSLLTTLIYPYNYINNTILMLVTLFLVFLVISFIVLFLFVRIELIQDG